MQLKEGDHIVSAVKVSPTAKVLNVTEKGFGKRTNVEEFKVQNRNGMGLKIHQLTERTGLLAGVLMVEENDELMLMTSEGVIIRLRAADISTIGRISQGVKLIQLSEGVSVVGVAKITEEAQQEEAEQTTQTEQEAEETAQYAANMPESQ